MTMTDPIAPPLELLDLVSSGAEAEIAKKILQWAAPILRQQGADQELEACCEWVNWKWSGIKSRELRATRRPKPPSLKEQALGALGRFNSNAHSRADEMAQDFETIRRALEALDD
jgi:hypothetical protein